MKRRSWNSKKSIDISGTTTESSAAINAESPKEKRFTFTKGHEKEHKLAKKMMTSKRGAEV